MLRMFVSQGPRMEVARVFHSMTVESVAKVVLLSWPKDAQLLGRA